MSIKRVDTLLFSSTTIFIVVLLLMLADEAGSFDPAGLDRSSLEAVVYENALLLESFGEAERAYELLETIDASDHPDARLVVKTKIRLLVKQGFNARADSLMALLGADAEIDGPTALAAARLKQVTGDNAGALAALMKVDSKRTVSLADYADFVKVLALQGMDRFEEAASVGMAGWRRGVGEALAVPFGKTLLDVLHAAGRDSAALALIEGLKKKAEAAHEMSALLESEVELSLAAGDSSRSMAAAGLLARDFPSSDEALRAASLVLSSFAWQGIPADVLLALCSILITEGDPKVERILAHLESRRLEGADAEYLRICKARHLFGRNAARDALRTLKGVFKTGKYRRQAMLLRARARRKLGLLRKAAATYESYAADYPWSVKAPEALIVASNIYERLKLDRKAREVRHRLSTRYPNDYYGRLAALRGAWGLMRKGDYDAARSVIEAALARSGSASEDLLYYLAEACRRSRDRGRMERALNRLKRLDPDSFYLFPGIDGSFKAPPLTSRGRVALDGSEGLIVFLERAKRMRAEAIERLKAKARGKNAIVADPGFVRGKAFLEMGFIDWAQAELELAGERHRRDARSLITLASLYDEHGMVWESVKLYSKLIDMLRPDIDGSGRRITQALLYPLPYPGIVMESCLRYDFPPQLAFAIIREESRFHTRAVSRAGALGLMQLLPETGRRIADEIGYSVDDESLLQPEINIELGVRYASRLLRRCNGNYHMMLAAYNAGMGNARRWFGKAGHARIRDQVDHIDFKETRNYVRRIVETSRKYSMLYDFNGEG